MCCELRRRPARAVRARRSRGYGGGGSFMTAGRGTVILFKVQQVLGTRDSTDTSLNPTTCRQAHRDLNLAYIQSLLLVHTTYSLNVDLSYRPMPTTFNSTAHPGFTMGF